jgi:hypothetical protein
MINRILLLENKVGNPVQEKASHHNVNQMITIFLHTKRALISENNWLQEILPPAITSVFI